MHECGWMPLTSPDLKGFVFKRHSVLLLTNTVFILNLAISLIYQHLNKETFAGSNLDFIVKYSQFFVP